MKYSRKNSLIKWLFSLSRVYFYLLFSWFLLYLIFGDGNGMLGLANSLAVSFFIPIPLIAIIASFKENRKLFIPLIGAIAVFIGLWGALFTNSVGSIATDQSSLCVMTFNILGRAGRHEPILKSILEEDADLIFLQELTPKIADVISLRLAEEYPYQILQPDAKSRGLGVISRYPLSTLDVVLPGQWMGTPQILEMEWHGRSITLVNFHTMPTGTFWPRWVRRTFEFRESDMQTLADYAKSQSEIGPLIVAGDANTTRLNDAYKSLANILNDAWLEAGFGLGHSFPAPIEEGSSFAQISFLRSPYWLVRIDYIFISPEFEAIESWMGAFYGGSDHRAVVSDLLLLPSEE